MLLELEDHDSWISGFIQEGMQLAEPPHGREDGSWAVFGACWCTYVHRPGWQTWDVINAGLDESDASFEMQPTTSIVSYH